MPIDERRRNEIATAVAAHNRDDRERLLLPPSAVRLLAIMFPTDTVYRRRLEDLEAEGFDRGPLIRLLESLVDTGFLSKEPARRGAVRTYHLHLPPRRQP